MLSRRTRKSRDMFGNPAGQAGDVPPDSTAPEANGARPRDAGPPRPVPLRLVPWLVPLFIVFLVVVLGAAPPLVAVPLVLAVLIAIGITLYRSTRNIDYRELRREDALYRGLLAYRRGDGYRGPEREE